MVLDKHPGIKESAVVGLPHEYYGEEVVAALRLKDGVDLSHVLDSARRLCRDNLNEVSVPTAFFHFPEFPTGSTGKLHKGLLRKALVAMRQNNSELALPSLAQ